MKITINDLKQECIYCYREVDASGLEGFRCTNKTVNKITSWCRPKNANKPCSICEYCKPKEEETPIDKAIKMLEEIIELIDEGWLISVLEKCPTIDSCELAIDIMRKYQKIVDIVSLNDEEFKQCGLKELKEILEVIAESEDK